MSASCIDLGYLTRFCKGDRVRMERYIRMYLDSAPGSFDGLVEQANAGDAEALAAAAHSLRPQVNYMGAQALLDALTGIEQRAREQGATACSEQVAHLMELNRAVMAELRAVLEAG
ncbi:MAG TPA: Hpt domain-containing protein [Flavobacteriales bacterium]|nr:Hpt domain-containing protein [Flavobacteriales bacterium]HMR27835.1 Hpt domain-containing protein [Flavobacteriales bacterium]